MDQRLRRVFNVIFPWAELVRQRMALIRADALAKSQTEVIEKLTVYTRELEEKSKGLLESSQEASRQLRANAQRFTDYNQKIVDLTERESAALNKLTTAVMQVANFQAFARGIKIPIFPGVGPDLPEVKPIDYEKIARQMPRTTRQAEQLANSDFLRSFSEHLEAEARLAEQGEARQE